MSSFVSTTPNIKNSSYFDSYQRFFEPNNANVQKRPKYFLTITQSIEIFRLHFRSATDRIPLGAFRVEWWRKNFLQHKCILYPLEPPMRPEMNHLLLQCLVRYFRPHIVVTAQRVSFQWLGNFQYLLWLQDVSCFVWLLKIGRTENSVS